MKWLIYFFATLLLIPNIAYAQDIRRCVKNDGTVTFTDKSCNDDEIEKQRASQNSAVNSNKKKIFSAPPACNKTVDDLLYSVRIAIDSHDVNQLAKNYHWANVSNQQANNIFNRLENIVAKPLIDIRLLQSSTPLIKEQIPDIDSTVDTQSTIEAPKNSYAIKIVQSAVSASNQQQSTTFKLQQNYGCYWLRF